MSKCNNKIKTPIDPCEQRELFYCFNKGSVDGNCNHQCKDCEINGVSKSLPHDCVKGLYRIKHCPNINKCSKYRDK